MIEPTLPPRIDRPPRTLRQVGAREGRSVLPSSGDERNAGSEDGPAALASACGPYCAPSLGLHSLGCFNFPVPSVWGRRSRRSEYEDEELMNR